MKINMMILILLLVGCQVKKEDSNLEHQSSPSTEVTLTTVKQGSIQSYITLSASTVYQRKTVMSAPIAGYVVSALVAPGDVVRMGQTLFVLESKESRAIGDLQGVPKIQIRAAHAGLVTEVMQQAGSFTPEGTPLCIIADLSSMVFELNIPYEQQRYVKKGTACEIILPDDTHIKGTLDRPLLSVDDLNQTAHYVVRAKHSFLPEGLIVQALISRTIKNNTHQILSKEAVQCDENMNSFWIMVMTPDSIATKVPVEVGNSNSNEIEIISPLLGSKDRIICSGSYGLTEGSLVKVVSR